MKRFMPFLFVSLFCMLTMNFVFAQTSNLCGTTSTESVGSPMCYDKSDYSQSQAKDQFKADMLSGYTCKTDSCARPALSECPPQIVSIPDPTSENNQWCFSGDVEWKCPNCTRKVIAQVEHEIEIDHGGGFQGGGTGAHISHDDIIHSKNSQSSIQRIYPNPASDVVRVNLNIAEEGKSDVEILVSDISGKQLLQKDYTEVPPSRFYPQVDLSSLSNGIYFINVLVNGKLIGSSKVVIQ